MTKNIFASIFAWIVNCYDNSFFEKIMSSIFGFFKNGSKNSVIVGFFSNNKSLWGKSRVASVIRFPFSCMRAFYHSHETGIESLKEKSTVYGFLKHPGSYSLRDYGTFLLCLGVGMLFGVAVFMKWQSIQYIGVTGAVIFAGAFMALSDNSCTNLLNESGIIRFVRKILMPYEEIEIKTVNAKPFRNLNLLWFVSLVIGFVSIAISPLEVLLGIAVAIAVVAILLKTEIGVFLFVPLSAILPTMALAGLVALTFVSFILHLLLSKKAEYVSTPFQPWIAVFAVFVCISAFTSPDLSGSLKILIIYIVFTMAYVLIVNTVKTRKEWLILVILFVGAATLVALYGVYQNFFLDTTTQSWVDEEMFTDIKKRVFSTLDNPNVLGEYFIMLIPIAVALLVKMRGNMQKLLYTACNLIMFACLMYTWSRGAWLGVVIGVVFFILLKDRRWLVLCIAGLLLMPSVLPVSIMDRLMSIGNMKDSSTAYRVSIWLGSIKMLQDYWLCGVGLGSEAFLSVYPQYALGGADFALHSHNFYLQWIVDFGIAGIFIYFGIIITAFKNIASVKEKNTVLKNVLLAMAGALCGYLFQGVAENLWYNYRMILVFWVYIGIIESGVILADGERKDVIR